MAPTIIFFLPTAKNPTSQFLSHQTLKNTYSTVSHVPSDFVLSTIYFFPNSLSLSISFVSCFSAAKEDEEEEEAHIFVFFSSLLSFFRFETNTNISCPFNFLSHKYHIKTLLFPLSQNQDSSFFFWVFRKLMEGC